MHRRLKKLVLHRETLRHLDSKDLHRIAGGAFTTIRYTDIEICTGTTLTTCDYTCYDTCYSDMSWCEGC